MYLLDSSNPGTSILVKREGKNIRIAAAVARNAAAEKKAFLNRFPEADFDSDMLSAKTGSSDGYISSLTIQIIERIIPVDAKYISAISVVPKKCAMTVFSANPKIFVKTVIVERPNTIFSSRDSSCVSLVFETAFCVVIFLSFFCPLYKTSVNS